MNTFADWCDDQRIRSPLLVTSLHVAAYIEGLQYQMAAPSVKLQLAALRMLFDWLVIGQIVPSNPASAVRGPKHVVKKSKTPVLSAEEARELLDAIDVSKVIGLRDRALISLMVYTFARVGAVIQMRVEDIYVQNRRMWVRLHEKGSKRHEMPCHHSLEQYLSAYIEGAQIGVDGKGGVSEWVRQNGIAWRKTHGESRRVSDDSAAGQASWHRNQNRLSHVSGHRHYGIST